jgi:hypothetical protein
VDSDTARMLSELPEDLVARGWRFVLRDSRPYPERRPRWYIAVYVRTYDPEADDVRYVGPIEGQTLRVSTNTMRSASWDDAHRDAISWMRFLDRQRQDGEF